MTDASQLRDARFAILACKSSLNPAQQKEFDQLQLDIYQEEHDALLDKEGLTPGEQERLDWLSGEIAQLEDKLEPMDDIHGLELLHAVIEQLKESGQNGVVDEIEKIVPTIFLGATLPLTDEQIGALGQLLNVNHLVFYPVEAGINPSILPFLLEEAENAKPQTLNEVLAEIEGEGTEE